MPFTPRQKQKEAEREVAMRRTVYGRRVQGRAMSQEEADKQIAIMVEIAEDYKAEADLLEGVGRLL